MNAPPSPRRRRRWLRVLGIICALVVIALIGAYFWVTSQGFVRHFVWGAVAKQTGCEVTSGTVSFNLFSHFNVDDLQLVGPAPDRDHVRLNRLEVSYSLLSLLGGNVRLNALTVASAEISLTRRGDGTVALLGDAPPSTGGEGGGGGVSLGALRISDVAIHYTDRATGLPEPLVADLTISSLQGDDIDTARGGKDLSLEARLGQLRQGEDTSVTGGAITGKGNVSFDPGRGISVSADLEARGFRGRWRSTPLDGVALTLRSEVTTDSAGVARIQTAQLDLNRGETSAGRLALTGQIDTGKGEGQLTLTASEINHETLEILMARPGGVDFGRSRAEGRATINLADGGDRVEISAQARVHDLSVLAPQVSDQRTPPLQFGLTGAATLHRAAQTLSLSALDASAELENRRLLTASLDRPLTLAMGSGAPPQTPPARFSFDLNRLDLAQVRPLLPGSLAEQVRRGSVSASGLLDVASGGQSLTAKGGASAESLVLAPRGEALPPLGVNGHFDVTMDVPAEHLAVRRAEAVIDRAGSGSGHFDVAGDLDFKLGEGTLQVRAENFDLTLPALALSSPDVWSLTSGTLDTDTVFTLAQRGQSREVSGRTSWSNLNVTVPAVSPSPLPWTQGSVELAATGNESEWTVSNVALDLGARGRVTGSGRIEMAGPINLTLRPERLDLAAAAQLLPADVPVVIQSGDLSGQIDLALTPESTRVAFDGTANLSDWSQREPQAALPPVSARATVTAAIPQSGPMTLDPLQVALTSDGAARGNVDGTLTFDPSTQALDFNGKVENLDVALADPFLPEQTAAEMQGRTLSYSGRLTAASGFSSFTSQGQLSLTPGTGGAQAVAAEMGVTLDHQVEISANHLQVQRADGTFTRGAQTAGQFNATADLTLDPLKGNASVNLQRAAVGSLIALVAPPETAQRAANLIVDGQQRLDIDWSAQQVSAQGDLRLSGLQVEGGTPVQISLRDRLSVTPQAIQVTDTQLTTQVGNQPAQPVTLAADIDFNGARPSTVDLTGGSLDLTPLLDLLPKSEAPAQPQPEQTQPTMLPGVPDPKRVRLTGNIAVERLKIHTLDFIQPRITVNWARLDPERPAREINVSPIDVQVAGPRNTGRLTGNFRASQGGDDQPLRYALSLNLTKTDFDNIWPTLAPSLVDNVRGSVTLDRCELTGQGNVVPRDLSSLQGGIVGTLSDGRLVRVPLISRIIELTHLSVLENMEFQEGGFSLIPTGDHMEIPSDGPFFVRGPLALLSATGQVYYDGRQSLMVVPGVRQTVPIPALGDLLSRVPGGSVFPTDANYPDYRDFPLAVTSSGTWSEPRVGLGAPLLSDVGRTIREVLPGSVGEIPGRIGEIPGAIREIPGVGQILPGRRSASPEQASPEQGSQSPVQRLENMIPTPRELPGLRDLNQMIPGREREQPR